MAGLASDKDQPRRAFSTGDMPYSSDEENRGRRHPDDRNDRHRTGREQSRLHDHRDHRADLESTDSDSGSSVRSWPGNRHNERAIKRHPHDNYHRHYHHHHQHPRSARSRSPSWSPKPTERGRPEFRRDDQIAHLHPRHSHSVQPSKHHDQRHHHIRSRARSLAAAQDRLGIRGRLAEKAVGTAAQVAFRLRNAEGSWVGTRGLKVVGATVATTAIDAVFDRHPKEHALRHIAISMVEGAVMDVFATSSPLGSRGSRKS